MQPISNGAMGGYPPYATCFDRLTTNGIISEDLMGYVTGTPSPYLQNYVAQRGGAYPMPGMLMPDTLVGSPMGVPPMPQGAAPQQAWTPQAQPQQSDKKSKLPTKDKIDTIKKIAAGALIAGLAVLGIVKGKQFVTWCKNTPVSDMLTGAKDAIVNAAKSVWNFTKNIVKRIFTVSTPTPPPTPPVP